MEDPGSLSGPGVHQGPDGRVQTVLASGLRTGDIMQAGCSQVSTTAMGDAVVAELDKLSG